MLRVRLSLLLAGAVLLALLGFAALADTLFSARQQADLEGLMRRELTRVASLLQEQAVGQRFLDTPGAAITLQFVTNAGTVVLPAAGGPALPRMAEPAFVTVDGHPAVVGSIPWRLSSGAVLGTIRLALDASDAQRARRALRRSLVTAGALIAVAAGLLSLLVLGRTLRPLQRLAREADRLDPAAPSLTLPATGRGEVGRVAEALHRALRAIRERQQAERDALAEVAHELAAPLSVVAGQLEALARDTDDPQVLAARDAANELLHTSQDLLTLARGELERPLELEAVALDAVVRRVAAEYPGVGVEFSGSGRVLGSGERLAQVVRNLVRNGIQAAGRADGVRLSLRGDGRRVELRVSDDGPGLDAEARTRLFERYFTRRRRSGGTGVGLTVVRVLVEAHGGSVSVDSGEVGGTTLVVRLPALEAQLEAPG